jgi:transketolase
MAEIIDITTAYSKALVKVGEQVPNLVVLDADIPDSCMTEDFHRAFPDRAFDLGIAEQSLPTFAAGLALMGKIPFYNTFAVFAVHRSLDMIRQSVAYNRANVKIVGHAAGQALGYAGPTHHTLEDVAVMRALPNMVILSPADGQEARQMVAWMAEYDSPVYLRLSRSKARDVYSPDYQFEMGKPYLLKEGNDVTVFATGDLVGMALDLHEQLSDENISIQVVSVPTLKPINADQILQLGKRTYGALTIEDHNVYGGLGSAIAEIYAQYLQKPVHRLGIPDRFTESDDREVLLHAYGVNLQEAGRIIKAMSGR